MADPKKPKQPSLLELLMARGQQGGEEEAILGPNVGGVASLGGMNPLGTIMQFLQNAPAPQADAEKAGIAPQAQGSESLFGNPLESLMGGPYADILMGIAGALQKQGQAKATPAEPVMPYAELIGAAKNRNIDELARIYQGHEQAKSAAAQAANQPQGDLLSYLQQARDMLDQLSGKQPVAPAAPSIANPAPAPQSALAGLPQGGPGMDIPMQDMNPGQGMNAWERLGELMRTRQTGSMMGTQAPEDRQAPAGSLRDQLLGRRY